MHFSRCSTFSTRDHENNPSASPGCIKAMTGAAVVILLLAMISSWMLRGLLLRLLRSRHPSEFAELGFPSNRQLASFYPQYREMQIRFWKYLWGGKIFRVNDRLVTNLARAALIADAALAVGAMLLLWSAWHSR
jgi:hypothetical protein